ncbi:MAG: hypothetical protein AAFX99_09085 [Myxococcota bacterium]
MSNNTAATVSLLSGLGLIASFFIGMCLGFIPFIGLLALLLYPLDWILAIVAVVAGFMGIRESAQSGEGKFESIVGMVIGFGFMILQLGLIGLVIALGGFGVVMAMLQNAV